jgi:integrase
VPDRLTSNGSVRAPRRGAVRPHEPTGFASATDPTVEEMAAAYVDYVDAHYVTAGRPASEPGDIRLALEAVCELYGHTPAREFGPLRLKTIRNVVINENLCRKEVNRRAQRIVRAFKWAVGEELVPLSTYEALKVVPPLRHGQAGVRESGRGGPVPDAFVDAIRPYVSRQVWAMVELQRLTGMRPGEVRTMRTADVDTSGPVWIYTPQTYEVRVLGHRRRIYLGPLAQEVLRPWLRADPTACLFQPRESRAEYLAGIRRGWSTPVDRPGRRRGKGGRPRVPGEMYSGRSYNEAIRNGILKANREVERSGGVGIPRWNLRQLRHNAATRLRREFGLDVARAVLGHRYLVVAQVYGELDAATARDAMARIG